MLIRQYTQEDWRLRERYKSALGINYCENCRLSAWQAMGLTQNCHALTNNYRGRAKLSALSEKRDVECRKFKETLTGNAEGNLEPSL